MMSWAKSFDSFIGVEFSHYCNRKELDGGVGVVDETEFTHLHNNPALNSLLDRLASNPHALARFQRKLEIASHLYHASNRTGYDPARANRKAFIAEEYLEGGEPWN